MTKKYKITKFDGSSNSVEVAFYDNEIIGPNNRVKEVSLIIGLDNAREALNANNLGAYISKYFPDDKIYPPEYSHDLVYVNSVLHIEQDVVSVVTRSSPPSNEYLTQLISEILAHSTSTVTSVSTST